MSAFFFFVDFSCQVQEWVTLLKKIIKGYACKVGCTLLNYFFLVIKQSC